MARLLWLLPAAVLLVLDRFLKVWAAGTLTLARPEPLIGNAIRLSLVHNTGGAFGLFPGNPAAFIAISSLIAATLLLLLVSRWVRGWRMRIGLAVLLAGAVGNLIDRALYGHVVDFFEIRGLFVFNLADACITVGAGLIILHVLFGGERHGSRRQADHL
jgi:signal peptidase II